MTLKQSIGRYIGALKKQSRSHAIRWTRPENLHVTLQFLAEVQSDHLSDLIDDVRNELDPALKEISLTLGSVHLFPNPFRPRVIVLDIIEQATLSKLSEAIGRGILVSRYEVENRPFRAHLTLGRIKHAQGVNLNFLKETEKPKFEGFNIKEVMLFRSEPQPEGSQYSVIERIQLSV